MNNMYCVFSYSQEWNDELAGVAQAYSTKCTTQPNGDRASQAKSFITVGENLGTISPPSSASYSALFETWFKGNLLYNYTTGKCIIKGICDSYKQVVSLCTKYSLLAE